MISVSLPARLIAVQLAGKRDAAVDVERVSRARRGKPAGQVDFRQREVQVTLAVDGEYRLHGVGEEGVAAHVGDMEIPGQRGVVRREVDGRLHDGVVDDLQHARRDREVRGERGVVRQSVQIDPLLRAEVVDDVGRHRRAVDLQCRRAREDDIAAADRRAGADFQRAGLDRRAAGEGIHAQQLHGAGAQAVDEQGPRSGIGAGAAGAGLIGDHVGDRQHRSVRAAGQRDLAIALNEQTGTEILSVVGRHVARPAVSGAAGHRAAGLEASGERYAAALLDEDGAARAQSSAGGAGDTAGATTETPGAAGAAVVAAAAAAAPASVAAVAWLVVRVPHAAAAAAEPAGAAIRGRAAADAGIARAPTATEPAGTAGGSVVIRGSDAAAGSTLAVTVPAGAAAAAAVGASVAAGDAIVAGAVRSGPGANHDPSAAAAPTIIPARRAAPDAAAAAAVTAGSSGATQATSAAVRSPAGAPVRRGVRERHPAQRHAAARRDEQAAAQSRAAASSNASLGDRVLNR